MSWDLSFDAATWASFPSTAVGSTGSFGFDGIFFNMLKPIANTTAFHQAIANLWNQSDFQSTVLGPAGTAGPALFPCSIFAASCDTAPSPYPTSPNYAAASALLCKAGLTPSITSSCDGTHFSSSTVWTYNGATWSPNWWWRRSLNRIYFSNWIVENGAKIGLTFNILGSGSIGGAVIAVFDASASAFTNQPHYVAGTPKASCTTWGCPGYDTKPTFINASAIATSDNWDMYSYGYSASVDYIGSTEMLNTAFGPSDVNPTALHDPAADVVSNAVIYATSPGAAAKANRAVATYQMNNLPMFNIYFENVLYAAYVTGWAGYAAIPNYGPDSGGGLGYTALNVYQTCYLTAKVGQNTCKNGGNFLLGLASGDTPAGGLNPIETSTTVYDNDIWLNIYDSVLGTPPTGFTAPLKFVNWMTTAYSVKTIGTAKKPFVTSTGSGWFDMQSCKNNACTIIKGDAVTFKIQPNIYWQDHVPFTAYDYNFSLYLNAVSLPSTLPDTATPSAGILAGPAGLMATYIPPTNPYQITLYINSSSAWNLLNTQVPLLPLHIFGAVTSADSAAVGVPVHPEYFNLDGFSTSNGAMDLNMNPIADVICAGCSSYLSTFPLSSWPAWLNNSVNLEIGTGPFILLNPANPTEEANGNGYMVMNPTYYRQFWQIYSYNSTDDFVKSSTPTVTLNLPVYDWSSNPTLCPTQADNICKVPVTSFGTGATWSVVKSNGKAIESGTATCSAGVCTLSISTASLPKGFEHVILSVPYTSFGLPRTWYQSYSFYLK